MAKVEEDASIRTRLLAEVTPVPPPPPVVGSLHSNPLARIIGSALVALALAVAIAVATRTNWNADSLQVGLSTSKVYDVVIVGGGLAGISAARSLVKDGFNVMILEAEPSLGGRAKSYYALTDGMYDRPIPTGRHECSLRIDPAQLPDF